MVTPLLYESKAALAYIASNILFKRDDIVVHIKNGQLLVHPYHQSYTCSLVTPQQWHKVITSIPRLTDVALVAKDRVLSL